MFFLCRKLFYKYIYRARPLLQLFQASIILQIRNTNQAKGEIAMLKVRLMGVEEEINEMIKSLKENHTVLQVSNPYPNRGTTEYVRVYVDVDPTKSK